MADSSGTGDADAARLEAALERIKRAGATRPETTAAAPDTQLAGRLDALIAEIRAALGKDNAD
jgi:hypothetical protein